MLGSDPDTDGLVIETAQVQHAQGNRWLADGMYMGDVADAWEEYLQRAEQLDLAIRNVVTRSESEAAVRATLAESGLAANDDIIEYFTVLGEIHDDHAASIFPNHRTLDLSTSIAHHNELLEFAADHAEDGDPDDVYAPTWHPVVPGKPTILVGRTGGGVVERWWDELDVRPIEADLASWIRSQTVTLEQDDNLDAFRLRVTGEAHIYFDAFYPHFTDYWLAEATTHRDLHRCSTVVIRSAPAGHWSNGVGLEEVHAQLVADLLVANGFPEDQITFDWEPVGDGRFTNTIFVKGYK